MMRQMPRHCGFIEVVCGPMFSGKSEELIRRLRRAQIARQNVVVFKPAIDDRYHADHVVSHDGTSLEGRRVHSAREIIDLAQDAHVVGIDEAQFFDGEIVGVIDELAESGKRVIVAALDRDFRGEPFGPMPGILAVAEFVDKLQAICQRCAEPATCTQRLIEGQPARYDDPVVLVGATDSYEPRCRSCHEVVRER
jgi:thymidine kinase